MHNSSRNTSSEQSLLSENCLLNEGCLFVYINLLIQQNNSTKVKLETVKNPKDEQHPRKHPRKEKKKNQIKVGKYKKIFKRVDIGIHATVPPWFLDKPTPSNHTIKTYHLSFSKVLISPVARLYIHCIYTACCGQVKHPGLIQNLDKTTSTRSTPSRPTTSVFLKL